MKIYMRLISKMIFLSIFFMMSLSAQAYPPLPLPPPIPLPPPHFGFCPITHSSICWTATGNACSMFVPSYQPSWFSGCVMEDFFYFCVNLPGFPPQLVQNNCYPKGSPCTCVFGLYYEPGVVL